MVEDVKLQLISQLWEQEFAVQIDESTISDESAVLLEYCRCEEQPDNLNKQNKYHRLHPQYRPTHAHFVFLVNCIVSLEKVVQEIVDTEERLTLTNVLDCTGTTTTLPTNWLSSLGFQPIPTSWIMSYRC